jgi:hypothetical protein
MPTTDDPSRQLENALRRVLRGLARVGLRHGMSCQAFIELVKEAHVEAGFEDFAVPGRKPTISRVAVLTGLTRKDIQRIVAAREATQGAADGASDASDARYNRAAKVVAGWIRDPEFVADDGEPRTLAPDGEPASFAALVRRHSGDMPARAVLDELLRVGTVERTPEGRIALRSRVYVPAASDAAKLHILGTDTAALVDTIDHNLQHGATDPRFQRKVMYDNLPTEAVAEFRRLSAVHAQALIESMDAWLAAHDRDANPAVQGTGRVVAGLGIYYFEDARAFDGQGDGTTSQGKGQS